MPKATITLLTSNFSNNTAYGGAAEPAGPLVVQGGGLYLQDATANVSSAVFLQNTAWVELAHEELSEAAGGGLALVTYQITGGSTSVLGLAHALFVLNSVGGAPRNFGGALYKDLPSVLEQVDVRVVPTEMELAGTEEEAHTSLNDVVLVAPVSLHRLHIHDCLSTLGKLDHTSSH